MIVAYRPVLGFAATVVLAACGGPSHTPVSILSVRATASSPTLRYEVNVGAGARALDITLDVPPGFPEQLGVTDGVDAYVRNVELDTGGGYVAATHAGDTWVVPQCSQHGCHVRYRFALADAASSVGDIEIAREINGAFEAPESTYLLWPLHASVGAHYRFHVTTPPSITFVTGVPPAPDAEKGAYQGDLADLPNAPFSAFGPLRVVDLDVGTATIEVAIAPGDRELDDKALLGWVGSAARAVTGYYHHYPVPRALVLILASGGSGVGEGETMGDGGASIAIGVGANAKPQRLARDWVLTHEMIHLSFPTLPRRHHWLEEGIATYVEPIARARANELAVDEVWKDMIEGMPNGLPGSGDRGLDYTPTWGRTYWGGALYCLLADVAIREATNNRKSLEDALRAILDAGGNGGVRWPITRALDEGDRGVGTPILRPLYEKMKAAPTPVDLPALFHRLGVSLTARTVTYDDAAPLAAIRRAMVSAPP